MKKFRKWLRDRGAANGRLLLAVLLTATLLSYALGSLVNGLSNREFSFIESSSSAHALVADPRFAPLKLLEWTVGFLPELTPQIMRLPSIVFAAMTLAALVYILRRWYGPRTATFGFIVLVCSAWLLHVGRLATPDVLYLWAIPALLVSHILLRNHSGSKLAFLAWVGLCGLLLYIPGLVWFVLLNAIWQWRDLKESWQNFRIQTKISMILVFLIILTPLWYSLAIDFAPTRLLDLTGLPHDLPQPMDVLRRIGEGLAFISVYGKAPNDIWLNHLPVLDAMLSGAFLTGIYFYAQHWQASRTRLITSFIGLGIILYGLGVVPFSVVVVLLYLIVAAGIAYILYLWMSVFPRNPIARKFGIFVVIVAVGLSCLYNLRQYFVAWPHHPETSTSFSQREIPRSKI